MQRFMSIPDRAHIGKLGEDIAHRYLINHGFSVVDRNYWKKWGEIDIIAKKGDRHFFVEVKSVSCEIRDGEVFWDSYRPEENVHPQKLKRLWRTIQSYCLEKGIEEEGWQLDVVTVRVDSSKKQAKVERIENIVL